MADVWINYCLYCVMKTRLMRGENHGGANPASGYSLIEAADLDDALAKAKGCPILESGGSIEVAVAIDM